MRERLGGKGREGEGGEGWEGEGGKREGRERRGGRGRESDSQVVVLVPFGVQCSLDSFSEVALSTSIYYYLSKRVWELCGVEGERGVEEGGG